MEGRVPPPPPPRLPTGKFLMTYREKRGKEKREKGWKLRRKEGKLWKGRWKIGIWSRISYKKRWGLLFFFFCFSLLKTTEICFGFTKIGIFYREKAFHVGKKIRKNYFAPSEKYACYAPVNIDTFYFIAHCKMKVCVDGQKDSSVKIKASK